MNLTTARALLNEVAPYDLTTVAHEALDVVLAELDERERRLREIETRARAWDHSDATEAERHVACYIIGR